MKKNQIHFVTFHQSYTYEDFIEGIKPVLGAGSENDKTGTDNSDASQAQDIGYEIADGIFKQVCDFARGENDANLIENQSEPPQPKPYVLIIDEINRGNISKIFGELITLIEDSKRRTGYLNLSDDETNQDESLEVTLPYSKKPFFVPDNVFILGTMNTADKSIASMDIALRRRFEFTEMLPNPNLLGTVDGIDMAEMLNVINKRIEYLRGSDFAIGHAYFIGKTTVAEVAQVIKQKVVPLLQEYFFEDWQKIQMVLGQQIVVQDDVETLKFNTLFPDFANESARQTREEKKRYKVAKDITAQMIKNIYLKTKSNNQQRTESNDESENQ